MTRGWWGQRPQQTWWRWLWQDDEHLNNWVKLGTVADALQVARTVSAQTLVPDKRFATGSKIMLVSTSSHLQWALISYFISCLEILRIRMRFLPGHDLVSSEHSKGRCLARPVHTKQAKAFLTHIWLTIISTNKELSSHPPTLSLTPKVRPRTASNLPNFFERLHTVIAFRVCKFSI